MVCVAVGRESCWGRGECRGSGGETAPAFRRCCSGALFRSDGQNSPGRWGGRAGPLGGGGAEGVKVDLGGSDSCPSRAGRGAWSSRDGDGVAGGRAAGGALRGPRHSRQISWSVGHP